MSPTLNGAAYIADFLIQQKVPYIFGLCGHGNLGLLDGERISIARVGAPSMPRALARAAWAGAM
jgi:hypothetical protein